MQINIFVYFLMQINKIFIKNAKNIKKNKQKKDKYKPCPNIKIQNQIKKLH